MYVHKLARHFQELIIYFSGAVFKIHVGRGGGYDRMIIDVFFFNTTSSFYFNYNCIRANHIIQGLDENSTSHYPLSFCTL